MSIEKIRRSIYLAVIRRRERGEADVYDGKLSGGGI